MKLIKTASGKNKIKMSKREWTDLGKKAGWIESNMKGFVEPSSRASFFEPPDDGSPECPICDGTMVEDDLDWICADEHCDGFIDNTPDYSDDGRDGYDEGADFGPWGPE